MNNSRLQRQVDSISDDVTKAHHFLEKYMELESEKDDLENQLAVLEERVRDLEYENEELLNQ